MRWSQHIKTVATLNCLRSNTHAFKMVHRQFALWVRRGVFLYSNVICKASSVRLIMSDSGDAFTVSICLKCDWKTFVYSECVCVCVSVRHFICLTC